MASETVSGTTVCLFAHTDQGSHALRALADAGVEHAAMSVIGDLGPAASQPGAEHHVTFDALHLPVAERGLFMDTIRSGGVVLAVCGGPELVEEVAGRHGALKVLRTAAGMPNPSHNVAR